MTLIGAGSSVWPLPLSAGGAASAGPWAGTGAELVLDVVLCSGVVREKSTVLRDVHRQQVKLH